MVSSSECRVFDAPLRDLFAVHAVRARASVSDADAVVFEVVHVLAEGEPLPRGNLIFVLRAGSRVGTRTPAFRRSMTRVQPPRIPFAPPSGISTSAVVV
jgi:hypothetical protein